MSGAEAQVSIASRARWSQWLLPYVAAVDVAALAVVLLTIPTLPQRPWFVLALFAILATLTDAWIVSLSSPGAISLSFPTTYAAAVLFGPCFGALTACVGTFIAQGFILRRGVTKTAFNTGQAALAGGAAGLAFNAFRTSPGLSLTANAAAYAAAAAAYILLNSALASGVVAFLGRPFGRMWLLALREGGAFYVAMAPLGALVANSYAQSPWTLLYFPLLLWVIYKGFALYAHLRTDTDRALVVLADTIDRRDPYTFQHSRRVAGYVSQIARRLDLPADVTELIVSAAHIHDLGKISIDNRILFKEGPLTGEERGQVNTHPAAGAELAGQFKLYGAGADIILHHHERWDGSGYPDGLVGEAIPLGSRIIAVADVYDAMTSDRPYRRALSHEVAVAELARGRDTQFDARMVDAFLADGLKPMSLPTPASESLYAQT
jgi:HD-GYP domain-containing protein (c-di-GMP phosphodiesterase class II)